MSSNVENLIKRIDGAVALLAEVKRLLSEPPAPAKVDTPTPSTTQPLQPETITFTIDPNLEWRAGKWGEYTFKNDMDGNPRKGALDLVKQIDVRGGKLVYEGRTYTHKGDFINRK